MLGHHIYNNSSDDVVDNESSTFLKFLFVNTWITSLNGYPSNMINGTLNRESHNSQAPQSDNNGPKWLYLKIPYISDRSDYRITKLFKKEGIPVRITHESTTLRQVLNTRRSNPTSCQRPECISNKNLCFAKNCINQIECTTCHLIYIGSTA